jgi:single-stranded-DNA-specific exonuclease
LEHAQLAVELLTTDDPAKAQSIAENLNKENALRQDISRQIFEEACAMLAEQKQIKTAIVLAKEGWHAGVIGIVASRLVDKYNLPTILISIDGKNAKGSCRSIPALDLYDAIRECADDLIQFGGHKQAAGLTLRTARIDAFRQHFTNVVAGKLNPADYEPKLKVDVLLDGSQKLALPILKQLKLLEPFGCDNPLPVFAMRNVQLRSPKIFGKEQKHLRFFVNYLNETYHSIMWNGSDYKSCLYNNATADIAFVPKINVFQGLESINLQVMAFNQGLVIYDYRQGNVDKMTLLKALLQTRSGVTVFTNEDTELPETWQTYANLHIRHYGTTAPDTENIFVLFDFPKAKIFTEGHFPVPYALGKTMIILYNVSEFQHLRKEVFAKVPDRRHLIFVYKYVMSMLKSNQVMRIADLKSGAAEQGLVLTDQDLQIFKELGYVDMTNDTVKAAVIQKHELTDSPTYVKLQQYGKDILDLYDSNFRISDAQINSLWENNKQEEK